MLLEAGQIDQGDLLCRWANRSEFVYRPIDLALPRCLTVAGALYLALHSFVLLCDL